MKAAGALLTVWLCFPAAVSADVYIKGIRHSEARYHHGNIQPAYDVVHEWWFGEGKVTFIRHGFRNIQGYQIEPAMRITLDKKIKRIFFANLSQERFWEFPWPAGIPACVDSALVVSLKNYRLDGMVKKTENNETLLNRPCDVYQVSEWILYDGDRFYERNRILKISREVPFDWRVLNELHNWIRRFFNPQPSYNAKLSEIQGFVMASEDVRKSRGADVTCTFQVLEISRKEPPPGIYDVTNNMTKKDKLTSGDLRSLRGLIYTMEW